MVCQFGFYALLHRQQWAPFRSTPRQLLRFQHWQSQGLGDGMGQDQPTWMTGAQEGWVNFISNRVVHFWGIWFVNCYQVSLVPLLTSENKNSSDWIYCFPHVGSVVPPFWSTTKKCPVIAVIWISGRTLALLSWQPIWIFLVWPLNGEAIRSIRDRVRDRGVLFEDFRWWQEDGM